MTMSCELRVYLKWFASSHKIHSDIYCCFFISLIGPIDGSPFKDVVIFSEELMLVRVVKY